jgi:hypothetical protein
MNEWGGVEPTVASDDALLDEFGSGAGHRNGTELHRLLAGWRQECRAVPEPELVSNDDAMTAIRAGQRYRRRWWVRVIRLVWR